MCTHVRLSAYPSRFLTVSCWGRVCFTLTKGSSRYAASLQLDLSRRSTHVHSLSQVCCACSVDLFSCSHICHRGRGVGRYVRSFVQRYTLVHLMYSRRVFALQWLRSAKKAHLFLRESSLSLDNRLRGPRPKSSVCRIQQSFLLYDIVYLYTWYTP